MSEQAEIIQEPSTEVAVQEEHGSAVVSHDDQPMSLVERAAMDPNFDLDRLERLMDMDRQAKEAAAKRAYHKAMADAQAELPRVVKGSDNSHTRSRYADLAAVDRAMKPVITKHGFSLSFSTQPSEREGWVRVGVTVAHREGHEVFHEDDFPLDNAGAKGNSNKTGIQAWGSTTTYARRYLKMMVFDVATSADTDGNAAEETVGPDEMTFLDTLLKETNSDRAAFFKYMRVEGMADIPLKDFGRAKQMLEKKKAQITQQNKESAQ